MLAKAKYPGSPWTKPACSSLSGAIISWLFYSAVSSDGSFSRWAPTGSSSGSYTNCRFSPGSVWAPTESGTESGFFWCLLAQFWGTFVFVDDTELLVQQNIMTYLQHKICYSIIRSIIHSSALSKFTWTSDLFFYLFHGTAIWEMITKVNISLIFQLPWIITILNIVKPKQLIYRWQKLLVLQEKNGEHISI